MKITTFFIDRFKEISLTTPEGIQEEGGVYGDESEYSAWSLSRESDTSDFVGVVKTNILYGELYKITLDTGNDWNNPVTRGTQNPYGMAVPRFNDFMNMDLQTYWDKIITGEYVFNGVRYSDYRPQSVGAARPGGAGGTGGPTPVNIPTLLEYAMGVKERIGWVEVNRTRASIYYELCYEGKTATSNHFYDGSKFIMTPQLFDPFNETFVSNEMLKPMVSFSYEKINPYSPKERYFTQSPTGRNSKRIGLVPIDTWFTWNTDSQSHKKMYKGMPPNEPNSVIGGFTTFPWPMGPNWGKISTDPTDYLISLVTGNHIVLDANLNDLPYQKKLEIPTSIGNIFGQTPIITAAKSKHFNLPIENTLTVQTEFGTISPISSVYPIDIWGEKILPEQLVQIGFSSIINTPSRGKCQLVDNLKNKSSDADITLRDPFGLDLYELDKQYQEVYSKFRFCPPRKRVKNTLDVSIPPILNKNLDEAIKIDINGGNVSSYYLGNSNIVTKIGAFNPNYDLSYDNSKLFSLINLNIESMLRGDSTDSKINFKESDVVIDSFNESAVENSEFADKYYTNPAPPLDDATNDTLTYVSASAMDKKFIDTNDSLIEKLEFRNLIFQSFNNELEVQYGIRNPNDFLTTNQYIPYGTYSHKLEKVENKDGSIQNNIKITQNGSDADVGEFRTAISNILKTSGANKNLNKIIGVASSGFPILTKNTVEESISDLKEQLTGVKEIIFRGSEVLYGAVSAPVYTNMDPFAFPELPKKFNYINTGIYVSGSVNLQTGKKIEDGSSSSNNSSKEPPKQSYGGWVFSGLWHRDGQWPKDHSFRSGLLGNIAWTPCDGGVNTGAWIKIPNQRVLVEYHDFKSYSNHTVDNYIHEYWKKTKNELSQFDGIGNPVQPSDEINASGVIYQPDVSSLDKFNALDDWEKSLVSKKKIMLDALKTVEGKVVILRLRDNESDRDRGLDKITTPVYSFESQNQVAGSVYYEPNHLLEEWIVANNISDNDSIMDRRENYGMRWYPEPTEHTQGKFKKDEWYRAVFLRAVTSPSNPNGQIAGSKSFGGSCREIYLKKTVKGNYTTNANNIKTFCDLLYVSEQILKMHRARLVEMKKYIDNKKQFVENSNSDFAKKTFSRSMRYVAGLKELFKLVKP